MNKIVAIAGLAVAWLLSAGKAQAEDKEPSAIVGIGPASEWNISGKTFSLGPSASIEFSAIKNWLEIEVGGATLLQRGGTEWEADVLFKKPFTLSETVELMVGAGPTWTYTKGEGMKTSGTIVFDFMFWPWSGRKFDWFLEPTYTYSFGKEHEKSIAVSVGLLIAIP